MFFETQCSITHLHSIREDGTIPHALPKPRLPTSSGKTTSRLLNFCRSAAYLASKPFCYRLNWSVKETSSVWAITGCRSMQVYHEHH